VSSPTLDAWPVPLPKGDAEAVIRLPPPARVEIHYDIEGGEEEATVFLQSVMHDVDAWKGFEIIRHLSVKNQGHIEPLTLASPRAGTSSRAAGRSATGTSGRAIFLDRQFVEVVGDKTSPISFVCGRPGRA